MTVTINQARLRHLINLYRLSDSEFLEEISKKLTKGLKGDQVFSENIKIDHLKRIDSIFNKGLSYYIDPSPPVATDTSSIFFRKKEFSSDLNLQAKKIVNEFEDLKIYISAISKLSKKDIERKLPVVDISENPVLVARRMRLELNYNFQEKPKSFLVELINALSSKNIFVFEFLETWNQNNRANIDGVFLQPNVIVLKRQEGSFKREIFTLAHEIAHYLLNIEEIDKINYEFTSNSKVSDIESWCNNFAFSFLIAGYEKIYSNIPTSNHENDYSYDTVKRISANTHLSRLALFTRMLIDQKISPSDYNKVKLDLEKEYEDYILEKQRIKEIEKANGIVRKGGGQKAINSPLFISTIQKAYYEGVISEFDVAKRLNVSAEKLSQFIE